MWQHQELLLACRSSFMECVTAKDVDNKNSKDAKKKLRHKKYMAVEIMCLHLSNPGIDKTP